MQVVKLALAVTSCLAIRSAAAQPAQTPVAPPPPPPAPDLQPPAGPQSVLPNLLSTAVGATLDGRVDYSKLEDDGVGFLALHLHGQYLGRFGLGGYLSLPIARVSGGDQSETALGNVELGGLAVLRSGGIETYVRGGFTVGPGSGEGELDGILVPVANLVPRPADALPTGFGSSWLRAGVGLRGTSGAMVFGGSAGVDFPLASDDLDGLLHLSGSMGVAQPGFGVAVGITLLRALEDSDENIFSFQVLGDAAIGRRARIYGALGFNPEDDDGGYSLGAGVRAGL
jgi:hypothetical protein